MVRHAKLIIALMLWALWGDLSLYADSPPSNVVTLPIQDSTDRVFVPISAGKETSHEWVGQILEDKQGFLWFSTRDGLDRYDGYQIQHYSPDPKDPITGVFVQKCCRYALYRDHAGKIWIGANESISEYDPETERFTHLPLPSGKLQGLVRNVSQDKGGIIWLASRRGLTRYNPVNGETARFLHNENDAGTLSSNFVRSSLETRDGTFWVATNESVDVFDRRTGRVTEHLPLRNPHQNQASTRNPYVRLLEDHSGVVWIASPRDGLAFIDPQHKKLTFVSLASGSEPQPGAWAIIEDRYGVLWVGTDRGLFQLDCARKHFVRYRNDPSDADSLPADWVLALFEDREGGIWVGTANAGVARVSDHPLPFKRYRRGKGVSELFGTNYVLSAYEESPGVVWAGTKGAINEIDLKTGRYAVRPIAENTEVASIAKDRSGQFWLGTFDGGLFRFAPATHQTVLYGHNARNNSGCGNNEVRALLVDHHGTVWAGAGAVLCSFDRAKNRFEIYKTGAPNSNEIDTLAEDAAGRLWIGSRHAGLSRFDPATGQFTSFRHSGAAGGLSSDGVTSILVDRSGTIWVGTLGGLNRLDVATGKFTVYMERDGLPSSSINGIAEDMRGDLWITTSYGLSHFSQISKTFFNYFRSDGVFDDLTGAWSGRSGKMLFGSYSGLTVLSPGDIEENRPSPLAVVLTTFRISDKPVPIGANSPLKRSISYTKSLMLSYNQNNLSFEFTALSYADPERTRYRYKLEGLERAWNEVASAQRFARYTSLAPGKYRFQVEGRTIHGNWSEKGAELSIVILPPWWSTWWFRTAWVLLIALAVRWAYHLRVGQLAHQLDLRFNERMRERTRIAQDLHDTLLQNIAGLCLQIGGLSKVVVTSPEAARERLKDLRQQGEECLREARQAVWNIRSLESEYVDLASALRESVEQLTAGTPVRSHFRAEGVAQSMPPELQEHLLRIGREAIINAVRHAHACEIEVQMIFEASSIRLRIADDGRGFDTQRAAELSGHFGLTTMRERAREINATIAISSKMNHGTVIEVKVSL
ncbi:ligand-binding sensor domain-containing protein [Edaphobacter modestus]|uniref:Two component regulator with propeller domain n=1 Tax=Edaphobacter modestus TaxID=388466 RepID=A0A4Q7YEP0_9BACT|nr:two-component regulator propeller domain-containing protein [Edaphobacter modestus]RZU35204.1 two component regulator with propeller domain [Edaphobacter modestus]